AALSGPRAEARRKSAPHATSSSPSGSLFWRGVITVFVVAAGIAGAKAYLRRGGTKPAKVTALPAQPSSRPALPPSAPVPPPKPPQPPAPPTEVQAPAQPVQNKEPPEQPKQPEPAEQPEKPV